MPVPSDYPGRSPDSWTKTHDGETAKVWRSGTGEVVTFTQSFNASTEYWEITDTTGRASEGKACGPFEGYLDALEYVNKFIPELGVDELPDEVARVDDDEVVEVGSYPSGATDRECADCEESVFTSFRVEYGDESYEWLCIKCASDRFGWSLEADPTVGFDVNGSGAEGRDAIEAAKTQLEAHSDALLGSGLVDENSLTTALQTLHRFKYGSRREDPDELPPASSLQRDVLNLVVEYRNDHPDVKWSEIRDALDELRRYAHEYAREEFGKSQGRREVLEEIQESGLTPNEWFAQNVNPSED